MINNKYTYELNNLTYIVQYLHSVPVNFLQALPRQCLYNQEIGAGCTEKGTGRYVIKGRQDAVSGQKYLMCS